jgi:uncharacterized protein YodC (DUF2158 family)
MERFQTGDAVWLKSGEPYMTITALGVYSGWTMSVSDTVACRWCEGEKQHETVFDMALLEKVASRGAPHRDRRHQPLELLHEKQQRVPSAHTHEPALTAGS